MGVRAGRVTTRENQANVVVDIGGDVDGGGSEFRSWEDCGRSG